MNTTSTSTPATGIVVTTSIKAGARDEGYESQQHAEGIVSARR